MDELSNSVKDSAGKVANGTQKAAQGASKLAKHAKRGVKKKSSSIFPPNKIKLIIISIIIFLVLLVILVGGISGTQYSEVYRLTALNEEGMDMPKGEDAKSATYDKSLAYKQTMSLLEILHTYMGSEREAQLESIRGVCRDEGVDYEASIAALKDETESSSYYSSDAGIGTLTKGTTATRSPEECIDGAVNFAIAVANDNSFHFGRMGGLKYSKTKEYEITHSSGCYFCTGNESKISKARKAGLSNPDEWAKTYNDETFVCAAYAHGGGVKSMKDSKGHSYSVKKYLSSTEWQNLGHISYSSLKKGDVLAKDDQFALYIGDEQVAIAKSNSNDTPERSERWNSSIELAKFTERDYSPYQYVFRYIGTGGTYTESYEGVDAASLSFTDTELEILAAFSVSVGNTELKRKYTEEEIASSDVKEQHNAFSGLYNYIDREGNELKLKWFGENKYKIDYEAELKDRLLKANLAGNSCFYSVSYETDENNNRLKSKAVENYYSEGRTTQVTHITPILKDADIDSLMNRLFEIDPDAYYVNDDKTKSAKDRERATNSEAVRTIAKETKSIITEGLEEIAASSMNIDGVFLAAENVYRSESAKRIVAIANSYTNPYNNGFRGLCESWVGTVFKKAGVRYNGSCCASASRDKNAKKTGAIPIGAAIYSGSSYKSSVGCECGRNAGHVAIYVGNNTVLGSQIPFRMTLSEWIGYYGYGGWYTGG